MGRIKNGLDKAAVYLFAPRSVIRGKNGLSKKANAAGMIGEGAVILYAAPIVASIPLLPFTLPIALGI